jgi:hypothetical protein
MNEPRSPRDWLLSLHADAVPQLDAVRFKALPPPSSRWQMLFHELFYPNRRVWQALALVWIGLAVMHYADMRARQPMVMLPQNLTIAPGALNPKFHESLVQLDTRP